MVVLKLRGVQVPAVPAVARGARLRPLDAAEAPHGLAYTLHPTPYTPHPTPYTLHPTPDTLHYTPHTLHPTPYTLHLTRHGQVVAYGHLQLGTALASKVSTPSNQIKYDQIKSNQTPNEIKQVLLNGRYSMAAILSAWLVVLVTAAYWYQPYTLHPIACGPRARNLLHHAPYTMHPTPYTLHPTPYTLPPTPYTLHPTPYPADL